MNEIPAVIDRRYNKEAIFHTSTDRPYSCAFGSFGTETSKCAAFVPGSRDDEAAAIVVSILGPASDAARYFINGAATPPWLSNGIRLSEFLPGNWLIFYKDGLN